MPHISKSILQEPFLADNLNEGDLFFFASNPQDIYMLVYSTSMYSAAGIPTKYINIRLCNGNTTPFNYADAVIKLKPGDSITLTQE